MILRSSVSQTEQTLRELLQDRILVLDGAMGTMVQALKLEEADVRGTRFKHHPVDLLNFVDVLCLTQPDAVTEIHGKYLQAGADIVTTNTFGASPVGMEEFRLDPETVKEINQAAVRCARRAAERAGFESWWRYKVALHGASDGVAGHAAGLLAHQREVLVPVWWINLLAQVREA